MFVWSIISDMLLQTIIYWYTHIPAKLRRRRSVRVHSGFLFPAGRLDFESGPFPQDMLTDDFVDRVEHFCEIINGDARLPVPQHYCLPGCCLNRQESIDKVMAAIISLRLVPGLLGDGGAPLCFVWSSSNLLVSWHLVREVHFGACKDLEQGIVTNGSSPVRNQAPG
jgi:hypothetical protein